MNFLADIKIDNNKSYQDKIETFVNHADMRIKVIYKKKLQDVYACDVQELKQWRANPELWIKHYADFI